MEDDLCRKEFHAEFQAQQGEDQVGYQVGWVVEPCLDVGQAGLPGVDEGVPGW